MIIIHARVPFETINVGFIVQNTKAVVEKGHQRVIVLRDGCGFNSLGVIKYLIFLLRNSCNKAKYSVEFLHSTCNAPRIRRKEGNGVS